MYYCQHMNSIVSYQLKAVEMAFGHGVFARITPGMAYLNS